LRESLRTVAKDLEEYDLYTISGRCAELINFRIANKGDEYLEDARFEVVIPRLPGILVADRHHEKPVNDWEGRRLHFPNVRTGYPEVRYGSNFFYVTSDVGDLRHQVATSAFNDPLRVCFREAAAGSAVELRWSLHGKNLRSPLSGTLTIAISEKVLDFPDPDY
jgi:hypothetical protein